MAQQIVSCENLGKLDDGSAGVAINHALGTAVKDVEERGAEDLAVREVTIKVIMTPRKNEQCEVHVEVGVKLPRLRTRQTVTNIRMGQTKGSRQLVFQEYDPSDPDQRTIEDEIDDRKSAQDMADDGGEV